MSVDFLVTNLSSRFVCIILAFHPLVNRFLREILKKSKKIFPPQTPVPKTNQFGRKF